MKLSPKYIQLALRHQNIFNFMRDEFEPDGRRHEADTITYMKDVFPGVDEEILLECFQEYADVHNIFTW